jgi:AcrR family transcriptional regulator
MVRRTRPARRTFHHGDLRVALTRAALAWVGRHGSATLSLRDTCVRVGVSPGAAYKHFAGRVALLEEVAQLGFDDLALAMTAAEQRVEKTHRDRASRAVARVEAVAVAYVEFALARPRLFELMFGPYGAGSSSRRIDPIRDRPDPYRLLSLALDELRSAGVISTSKRKDAELACWSMMHGLAEILLTRSLARADAVDVEATARRLVRTVIAGLR